MGETITVALPSDGASWVGGIDRDEVRIHPWTGDDTLQIVLNDIRYDHWTGCRITKDQAVALRLYLDKWLGKLEHGQ